MEAVEVAEAVEADVVGAFVLFVSLAVDSEAVAEGIGNPLMAAMS